MSVQFDTALEQWRANVEAHLRYVFDTACASPLGGDEGWEAVLSHYGVTADPVGDRRAKAQSQGLERGPVVDEVQRACQAIATGASGTLEQLAHAWQALLTADAPRAARLEEQKAWLNGVVEQQTEAYRQRVAASVSGGVAGIFANVQATAQKSSWDHSGKEGYVMACINCGAAQEQALDIRCRFCGGELHRKSDR